MNEQFFKPGDANSLIEELTQIGVEFIKKFPEGTEIQYKGDPSTVGVTMPGRIYVDPTDHTVLIKYSLLEGKAYDGMGAWSPSSVEEIKRDS